MIFTEKEQEQNKKKNQRKNPPTKWKLKFC